jgi:hypothetical protein
MLEEAAEDFGGPPLGQVYLFNTNSQPISLVLNGNGIRGLAGVQQSNVYQAPSRGVNRVAAPTTSDPYFAVSSSLTVGLTGGPNLACTVDLSQLPTSSDTNFQLYIFATCLVLCNSLNSIVIYPS